MIARFILAVLLVGCLANVAYCTGGYDKKDETDLYTLRLRVPAEVMSIEPLKRDIITRYKKAADQTKANAVESKKERPGEFRRLALDTRWQVTFDNAAVLSVSGYSYEDQGGAHPNGYFEAIVWDKKAHRAVPIDTLFNKNQAANALQAIATAAQKSWISIYKKQSGETPSQDLLEQSKLGITPTAKAMKNYALTHAKGQASVNGIVLLYGEGEIWAHALGEFRLSVPVAVFSQYLKPEWRAIFHSSSR